MNSNSYSFIIVVNNKVTKSFIDYYTDNYIAMATGMMCVEFQYHKTASMYVYQKEENEYKLIKKMDAKEGTIMPESFAVGTEPMTLNEIAKMHENNIY